MKIKLLILTWFVFLVISSNGETVHQWDVVTITLKSGKVYKNPYNDIPAEQKNDLLRAVFKGISGDAMGKEILSTGFWYGGSVWHINFAPPETGTWRYTTYSGDKSLDGKKGSVEVVAWSSEEKKANPIRNGLVRVKKDGETAGHFFEYTNGIPFLWIGDTWWNWTDKRIHFESFKELVDNRSEKGYNVGQLFVPGNGWGMESSLLDETYTIPDTAHINAVEKMIKYANSKGITVWIHGWWSRSDLNITAGPEKIERWWRYLVHRFGAYNVIWVLAGEYNMYNYGGLTLDFWKKLGLLVKNEDPYERILSVHNTPPFWDGGAGAPQWSTGEILHSEGWMDYNQSQVGHGKFANEMIPQVVSASYFLKPSKPIVVTEPWYEFIEGYASAMDIRFGAWSAILSGAAGHSYGGGHVWLASVPEAPANEKTWQLEAGFNRTTYDYEGAMSMKYLAAYFKNIEWWNMSPHPELVKEYPQPLCLAKPGKEYIVYLRYGGVAKIEMDNSASSKKFSYQWYNPGTGKFNEPVSVIGSEIMTFSAPESYPDEKDFKDWVLYIRKE